MVAIVVYVLIYACAGHFTYFELGSHCGVLDAAFIRHNTCLLWILTATFSKKKLHNTFK